MLHGVGATGLAAVLLLAVGCGDIEINVGPDSDEPVETRDDSYTVGASPRLEVESFNGSIAVTPGSGDTIRVQATLRRADKLEYSVTQSGDTVRVEATREAGTIIGRSPGAEIEVTVPPSASVVLRTSNGMIEVRGLEESVSLRTSNGKIVVADVTGAIEARTSNGGIEVTGLVGSAELETSNGRISFAGELVAGSSSEMQTSNGSVDVTLEGTPSVQLDASTSNGDVESDLPVLATSTGDRHLVGTVGDGEADLRVQTSNGSVTIR